MNKCDECDKETLRDQIAALRDLIEVAKAVVSTLDLDTLLQAILESAMQYAGTPAGSVALYDEKKRELSLHAHRGLTADFVKVERWELVSGGLTEQVLLGGELLIVEDTHATPFFKNPVALNEGIRALICVPLVVKKQIVGILYLDDFVARTFDRGKLELLSILASFAALAIYNAKLHNKTKLLAITDALTGLHNHRYFQQLFAQEMGRAKRYRKPLGFIILDVDDFKKFNDSFGHAAGDRVLAAIGSIIDKTLRRVDFAFRYGGEEFVILLPETRQDSAVLVANRLRERIAQETLGIINEAADRGVTVSVGVAAFPENGTTREELFEVADRLLYQAKESGKNQVQFVAEGVSCAQ